MRGSESFITSKCLECIIVRLKLGGKIWVVHGCEQNEILVFSHLASFQQRKPNLSYLLQFREPIWNKKGRYLSALLHLLCLRENKRCILPSFRKTKVEKYISFFPGIYSGENVFLRSQVGITYPRFGCDWKKVSSTFFYS